MPAIRGLLWPGILLAGAVAVAAVLGQWLAGDGFTGGFGRLEPPTDLAYEAVDGRTIATQVTATVQTLATSSALGAPGASQAAPRRPRFAVCVQDASGRRPNPEQLTTQMALAISEARRRAKQPQVPGTAHLIGTPCPLDPPLLAPDVTGVVSGTLIGRRTMTETPNPSPFEVFVYIVADEVVLRFLPSTDPMLRRFPHEGQCRGDVCFGYSLAYYVAPNEFRDTAYLAQLIGDGFGYFPVVP
ncbi:MAG: hypothetical protein IT306_13870 [Chloroflexi bacterium]|nr:hypothetical protein [Chloroflexota bacterium]